MSKILDKICEFGENYGRLKFKNGVYFKGAQALELSFISDFNVEDNFVGEVTDLVRSSFPNSVKTVKFNFEKLVAEEQFVINEMAGFIHSHHKALDQSIDFSLSKVKREKYEVDVEIFVESSAHEYIIDKRIDGEIKEFLETRFVENFKVRTKDLGEIEVDRAKLEYKPIEKELYKREVRTFKVDDVTRLFDKDETKECTYIADTKNLLGEVYVAGVIRRMETRETKTGKPYYIIEITDRTGVLTGSVFPTKTNQPKMEKLEVGSEIIARGEFAMRGDFRNFTYRSINLCIFPQNFVPKERESRPCPSEYTLVFPKPLEIETQDNFLEVKTVPECFKGRTFVVFDLETTGTDLDDKITEIGAVKLVDGVPTEYFETLVNPGKHIPPIVEELTGISDETVKDAPDYSEVCADFYKFCHGATLVAHNMDFDSRFVKNQSKPLDFYFDHPLMDTLALARESIFGVSNYKLNTLCDKFGITFRHHRAYSDALATSELFVEIIRIRGSLPF